MWWIKTQEGYHGSAETQPDTRPGDSGFQCQTDKFPWLPATKKLWGLNWWKKHLESQTVPLKECTHELTQTHSLWVPAVGEELERHQWHTGRNWSVWHQGKSWETAFSLIEKQAEVISPFWTLPPQNYRVSGGYHIWDSINLANTVCPTLEISWGSIPHKL